MKKIKKKINTKNQNLIMNKNKDKLSTVTQDGDVVEFEEDEDDVEYEEDEDNISF